MADQTVQNGKRPGNPCLAILADGSRCLRPDSVKPTVYRGEPWCCENHRKLLVAQREARGCEHDVSVCPGFVPHDKCCAGCHRSFVEGVGA